MGLTITLQSAAYLAASTPSPATVNVATGLPGPQGTAGVAATIAVGSVSTLPAGSSATVNNSGTSSAAVFNFGIPQGAQGIQGIQGVKGDTGATGVGVPSGGSAGQILSKVNGSDYNTQWVNVAVTSVAGKTGDVTLSTSDISGMSSYATIGYVNSFVTSQGYLTTSVAALTYVPLAPNDGNYYIQQNRTWVQLQVF